VTCTQNKTYYKENLIMTRKLLTAVMITAYMLSATACSGNKAQTGTAAPATTAAAATAAAETKAAAETTIKAVELKETTAEEKAAEEEIVTVADSGRPYTLSYNAKRQLPLRIRMFTIIPQKRVRRRFMFQSSSTVIFPQRP
jgi:hypothetical protein